MWNPRTAVSVGVVVVAAAPLFVVGRGAGPLAVAGAYLLACTALAFSRRRAELGWLAAGWMMAGGVLLALGADALVDVADGALGLRAQEPGHMPLVALRAVALAVSYWAVAAQPSVRVRGVALLAQGVALALSTWHGTAVVLPVVGTFAILFRVPDAAPVPPGTTMSSRLLTMGLAVLAVVVFAAGIRPRDVSVHGPPAGDDAVVQTRYWMDEVDNPLRAAGWAQKWAAQERDVPGEGTWRLARLGLRVGETDAARALLQRVAGAALDSDLRARAAADLQAISQ